MLNGYRWKYLWKQWRRLIIGLMAMVFVLVVTVVVFKWGMPEVAKALGALNQDKGAVLFGTATLVMTLIAVMLAITSFFGWASIRDKVEFEVERKLGERKLDQAEAYFTSGAVYGVLAEYFVSEQEPSFLVKEAITFTRRSLAVRDELEGENPEIKNLETKAKNNLAYMLALSSSLGTEPRLGDAQAALKMAREVWATTGKSDDFRVQKALTLGRVVAEFAVVGEFDPEKSLKDTLKLMRSIEMEKPLDEYLSKELKITQERLEQALEIAKDLPQRSESAFSLLRRAWRAFRDGRW